MSAPKTPKGPAPVLVWQGETVRIVVASEDNVVRTIVEVSIGLDALGSHVWEAVPHEHKGGPEMRAVTGLAGALVELSGKRPDWDRRGR